MTWTNNKCLQLIDLYERQPVLWDPKHENRYNKSMKENAWSEIGDTMEVPISELKKKMTALLGSFRREKSRRRQSLLRDSGQPYRTKWFAFSHFHFLGDKTEVNSADDSWSEDMYPVEVLDDLEENQSSDPLSCNPSPKKRRRSEESKAAPASTAPEKPSDSCTDPYYNFGRYIGNELRKYDQRTLAHVKHAINNIIFEADVGKFNDPQAFQPNQNMIITLPAKTEKQ